MPDAAILVSEEFLVEYPQVLGDKGIKRQRILEQLYSKVIAGSPANRRGIFRPNNDSVSRKKKTVFIVQRSEQRAMLDDNLPIVRNQSSSSSPSDKRLVPAVTSNRYNKDPVPSIGIGRNGLRQ